VHCVCVCVCVCECVCVCVCVCVSLQVAQRQEDYINKSLRASALVLYHIVFNYRFGTLGHIMTYYLFYLYFCIY